MDNIDLDKIKRVHFVGIGGIGMSALARLLKHEGKDISGSDLVDSELLNDLKKEGVEIYLNQVRENIKDSIGLVVYTVAVSEDNPEIQEARKFNIPTISYPELLGIVSKGKKTVAVAGTHGKTTTASMIAKILIEADLSPTVIVGSLLKEYKSNFVPGNSDILVVEACEYKRSFLNLKPDIAVITNIEEDHLDYYENIEDIKDAFKEFISTVPESGCVIYNHEDSNARDVVKNAPCKIINYLTFKNLKPNLKVPGQHNILNSLAALSATSCIDVSESKALSSLETFTGAWRRFEYKGKTKNGSFVYDDYAHHPTEIKMTLKTAHDLFPNKKVVAVFQPHLYSRTKKLLADFAGSFEYADYIIVAPIYAAREKKDASINERILVKEIKKHRPNAVSCSTLASIVEYVELNINEDSSVIITIGAGDIYRVADTLVVK